jgi:thiol-disulfide isomerase/thioredoxin
VKRPRLVSLAIGCVLAGLLALGLFGPWGTSSPLAASVKLPPTLPALSGHGEVSLPKLNSHLSGPTVVTFFASWCGPCAGEMPAVARFAQAEKAKGVNINFVGIDENDPSGGPAFVKKSRVSFPVGTDLDGVVLEDLGYVPGLPQTIFINSSGVIVHHAIGPVASGSSVAGSVLQTWVDRLTA